MDKSKENHCQHAKGIRIEPAAPNVERPRLPDANVEQPMHDDVVEYPDGAPGDLVREMKEPDPGSEPLCQRRDRWSQLHLNRESQVN